MQPKHARTTVACMAVALLFNPACTGKKDRGSHPDPLDALLNCTATVTTLMQKPPERRSALAAAACAGLYAHPACRKAFASSSSVAPARRALVIMERCRKAYCPRFQDRKPKICTLVTLPPGPSERLGLWEPLDRLVTEREFGKAAAARALKLKMHLWEILQTVVDPFILPRAAATPRIRTTALVLLTTRQGKTALFLNGVQKGSWPKGGNPDSKALSAFANALGPPRGQTDILLKTDPSIPFSTIVLLMDVLRTRGFVRFSLGGLPRPPVSAK